MSDGINPEVIRLLSKILGDDKALLNRLSRMRPKKAFPEMVSPGEPFLSKRERHLLEWHREEVARLLLEGSQLAQLRAPVEETGAFIDKGLVEEQLWNRDCSRVLRSSNAAWPPEKEELRRAGGAGRFRSHWARLACSLVPSDDASIFLASALISEGSVKDAKSVAEGILRQSRSSRKRSAAFSIVADCHYRSGELDSALDAYRSTSLEQDPEPMGPLFWLAHAFRVGDSEQVQLALHRMESACPVSHAVEESSLVLLAAERRKGAWPSTPARGSLGQGIQLNQTARKVLDAIQ